MSLESILDHLHIEYSDVGKDLRVKCLNPAHNDKNPSMYIGKEFPYPIYCFSCGYQGSIVKNSEEIFGNPFSKITQSLGLDFSSQKKFEKKVYTRRVKPDVDIQATLIPVFQNKQAMDYVKSRNISDDFIRFFDCFYMQEGTIITNKEESKWYKRLCIPVYDAKKNIISLEGRDITRQARAKVLYPKGANLRYHLFNWENIDKEKPVYICEGIMGLSTIWQIDRNVISTYGKELTDEQKAMIKQLHKIIIVPDNDWNKGKDNLLESIRKFESFYGEREFEVVVIEDEGKDPNDYTVDEFRKILVNNRMTAAKVLTTKYEKIGELI